MTKKPTELLNQIDLFYGRMSEHAAHVYARLEKCDQLEGVELTGTITGPHSISSTTLTTESLLADMGPGKTLLANSLVPDPCYWSPKMPAWYDVELVLQRGQEVLGNRQSMLGLRMLGAVDRDLLWEGKRWQVNANSNYSSPIEELDQWSDERTALIVERPTNDYCQEASRQGVWLFAVVSGNNKQLQSELKRLACWPAVAVAIIESEQKPDESLRTWAPNLLLAQSFRCGNPVVLSDWAHLAICEINEPKDIQQFGRCEKKPVLAWRTNGDAKTPEAMRAACRSFQADLKAACEIAGYDLAGYVV